MTVANAIFYFLARIPTIILVTIGIITNNRRCDEIETTLDRIGAATDRVATSVEVEHH